MHSLNLLVFSREQFRSIKKTQNILALKGNCSVLRSYAKQVNLPFVLIKSQTIIKNGPLTQIGLPTT